MHGHAWQRMHFLLALVCLVPLAGCIRNQMYRAYPNGQVDVPPPAPVELDKHKAKAEGRAKARAMRDEGQPEPKGKACKAETIRETPCLAFVEFDELGEFWERNPSGRPAQLSNALRLIREARKRDPQTLVLVFVHGWKHNAASDPEDTNITGFKAALESIHRTYTDESNTKHAVLGIYVSWRGGLISGAWPVAQQFSYFNRESTAIRVGNTSLTDALVEISAEVQHMPLAGDTSPARLVMIGHSFGGLVLERAISQAMIMFLEKQYQEQRDGSDKPVITQPLANLLVFVNSAAGANEGKQMMDYLASSHFAYEGPGHRALPLILSVTSKTDSATGMIFKVGHGASWLGYWAQGSMRPKGAGPGDANAPSHDYARACFDPGNEQLTPRLFDMSQTGYYMTTTAHSAQLQSHVVTETPKSAGAPPGNDCMTTSSAAGGPKTIMSCNLGQYTFTVSERQGRCNGTPYWAMEVPKELIPDHNTIFTGRLITFLTGFVAPVALEEKTPKLSRPAMAVQ
ncbi:hypothetical protein DYQ86_19845 [Acidobacteria bacterium AB60]|nr:hypothetical protein DYQ86_19845 [Acidobacteria bacterium AB60]